MKEEEKRIWCAECGQSFGAADATDKKWRTYVYVRVQFGKCPYCRYRCKVDERPLAESDDEPGRYPLSESQTRDSVATIVWDRILRATLNVRRGPMPIHPGKKRQRQNLRKCARRIGGLDTGVYDGVAYFVDSGSGLFGRRVPGVPVISRNGHEPTPPPPNARAFKLLQRVTVSESSWPRQPEWSRAESESFYVIRERSMIWGNNR